MPQFSPQNSISAKLKGGGRLCKVQHGQQRVECDLEHSHVV